MRLLMAGDTHGAWGHVRYLVERARSAEIGADAIVQLGDFGYWEHTKKGKQFLDAVEALDFPIYWIDGNHENHTVLRLNYGPGGNFYNPTPEGFWKIRENIYYIPRATTWTWDGVKFLALGGAYSIDKVYRTEHVSWWSEELITYGETLKAIEAGKVDVLLSHDSPVSVPLIHIIPGFFKDDEITSANRQMLEEVVFATHPTRLFHGHYHYRYSYKLNLNDHVCMVEGLGCENVNFPNGKAKDSWLIYDTEE